MATDEDVARLAREYESTASRHGRLSAEAAEVRFALLAARNDAARERGLPYLRRVDLGVHFEPNGPDPVLLRGRHTVLVANPHFDDEDQRKVAIAWNRPALAALTPGGTEGLHRLSELGLGWWPAAVLVNSPMLTMFTEMLATSLRPFADLQHFVIDLRDQLFHAIAVDFEVTRVEPVKAEAIEHALDSLRADGRDWTSTLSQ